jgi:glucose/arabinose dehydrogenase
MLTALACLTLAGCGGDDDAAVAPPAPPATASTTPSTSGAAPQPVAATEPLRPRVVETLTKGLRAPWGLVLLPDGSVLISLRDSGEIVRVADGARTSVGKVDGAVAGGEGGLMGIAIGPDFDTDPAIYAYFTALTDNRLVKIPYRDNRLGSPVVILSGIRKAIYHDGGRIAFGPDGKLYLGTGDASSPDTAQDKDSLNGKILRMNPDGSVPSDNPISGSLVYSMGHRNVQGLDWDTDGNLWSAEFGQKAWDELNLIQPGANYGWPKVEGKGGEEQGFVDPVAVWRTDDASPSGIAVAGGSIWMAALKGERLWQIPITKGGKRPEVGEPRAHFQGDYGRLRTVLRTPDGGLYLINNTTDGRGKPSNDDDRLFRVELH